MTRQTVSICNVRGGVALDADEAEALAGLLEWASRYVYRPGGPYTLTRGYSQLRRVVHVLRGETPAEAGEPA